VKDYDEKRSLSSASPSKFKSQQFLNTANWTKALWTSDGNQIERRAEPNQTSPTVRPPKNATETNVQAVQTRPNPNSFVETYSVSVV